MRTYELLFPDGHFFHYYLAFADDADLLACCLFDVIYVRFEEPLLFHETIILQLQALDPLFELLILVAQFLVFGKRGKEYYNGYPNDDPKLK